MAEDNQVLPAAAAAGGMNPQVQAFLNLLMGGGLHGFGEFGGHPFGGFGHFLMNNPTLMRRLGLPVAGQPDVQDASASPAAAPAAPAATPAQVAASAPAVDPTVGGQTNQGNVAGLPPLSQGSDGRMGTPLGWQMNPASTPATPEAGQPIGPQAPITMGFREAPFLGAMSTPGTLPPMLRRG